MSDDDLSRRAILRGGAALSAASALFGPALARAMNTPANGRTGSLRDVEHVVIFMQENRSFDHYFGTMAGVRGLADRHPVRLPGGGPVWRQPDGHGGHISPFVIDSENTNFPVHKSLDHSWSTGHAAFNDGRYDRWVSAKSGLTMGYLRRGDIPYHFALADAFTVCDAYHCSLIGPTVPNRLYLMTGCVDPHNLGGHGPVTGNTDITQRPDGVVFGRGWKTYAERLQDAGISWQLYRQGDDPKSDDDSDGGMNTLLAFAAFQDARPGEPLYERGVRPRRLEQLKADVQADRLAQVSWITPPRLFCEHPNWPPAYGAEYLARILDALTSNAAVWSKTVLLVMYDENDGYFDHVVPPVPPFPGAPGRSTVPTDDERHPDGRPYGLGMRVPMLAISPWSRGGWVCSETFDHTSVIRFLEQRFGVREPNISAWRRTICGDLTAAFDFRTPRHRLPHGLKRAPVEQPLPRQAEFNAYRAQTMRKPEPVVPQVEAAPVVEQGRRKIRPLGYALAVDVAAGSDAIELRFHNHGKLGAAFSVDDARQSAAAPRRYTVEPGKTITDSWAINPAGFDLLLHGPAGFVRHFRGSGGSRVSVSVAPAPDSALVFTLRNNGDRHEALRWREARTQASATIAVAPGEDLVQHIALDRSDPCYDLTLSGAEFEHLYVGRVEPRAI